MSTADTTGEAGQRRELSAMQRRATGLLAVVTAVFIACVVSGRHRSVPGWVGYVQAFAEAAMVGALADWFAVTALFRHPLGLPIPHTAIVPRRKDAIGASLGTFVQTNFLDADNLEARARAAQPAVRLAAWLAAPANRARVAAEVSAGLAGIVGVVDDDEVSAVIGHAVASRLAKVDAASLAARALEVALADGRDARVVEAGLGGVIRALTANRDVLRARFAAESPWWVPGSVDEKMFQRIYGGIVDLLTDVRAQPTHQLRTQIESQLQTLVEALRSDPEVARRAEALKFEMLDHPGVRAWSSSLWLDLKAGLVEQAADPDGELRHRIDDAVGRFASTLHNDEVLRRRIDDWIAGLVRYVSTRHGHEVANIIRTTVERWDADDTSRRIELQIGRDLQFIRINGTLVGGLAGLAIHVVVQVVG